MPQRQRSGRAQSFRERGKQRASLAREETISDHGVVLKFPPALLYLLLAQTKAGVRERTCLGWHLHPIQVSAAYLASG